MEFVRLGWAVMYEPVPLAKGLERYFRNLGAPPVNVVASLANEWESIVGPALAAVTNPVEIIDEVLTISCNDSAWASQISWMETQIKDGFYQIFRPTKIVQVKTKIG